MSDKIIRYVETIPTIPVAISPEAVFPKRKLSELSDSEIAQLRESNECARNGTGMFYSRIVVEDRSGNRIRTEEL